jgi:lysophospholipid acyltransferase (LPLAT)-like uncharacterized protein
VMVSPSVASKLARPLEELVRSHIRTFGSVDPEVAAFVEAITTLGRAHRARHSADVPHGTVPEPDDGIVVIVNTTAAAARLGISERAVRARLERGTLAGERTVTGWRVYLDKETAA